MLKTNEPNLQSESTERISPARLFLEAESFLSLTVRNARYIESKYSFFVYPVPVAERPF